VLRIANFLQRVGAHVMICNDNAICGYERAAASRVETDARFLQMFQPLLRRFELIFLFELPERRRIENPHSFISGHGCI
jgi:hypothetical protein